LKEKLGLGEYEEEFRRKEKELKRRECEYEFRSDLGGI